MTRIERLRLIKALTEYVDVYTDENGNEVPCELTQDQKEDIKAIQHAIKCVELMPQAIEWIETLKEYSEIDCEELIEFLEKAKELIK